MKKTPSRRGTARRITTAVDVLSNTHNPSGVGFSLSNVQRVNDGNKKAICTIELGGLTVEAELFAPEGKPKRVKGAGIYDRYTGLFRRTVKLDAALAADVLDALTARLQADGESEESAA